MKHPMKQCLAMIISSALLSACVTSDLRPLRATDDCGPKPKNYRDIAAAWFNANYRYTPPIPITGDQLSVTEPARVATSDPLLGRKVGWQIILGPENKMVTNFTELSYTRLIINRDRIVSITSSDEPFPAGLP